MPNDQEKFLDVEDDEQRQNRIGSILARLNDSSSTLVSSNPTLNIGQGQPPGPIEVPAELLERVRAFLPAISASNEALTQMIPEDIDIENVQEDEEQYIEMNLGLGVFEAKPRDESGPRSTSPSSEGDASSNSLSESESDSEYSRSYSEEDSESEESDSSSSSDDDSDSGPQSGSSVDMKPIFSRPIKPLPRRVSGKTNISAA